MEKLTPDNPHISATLSSEGNLYFFANKWNGENVSVFKYSDGEGKFYVSARPRGHAFIKDNRNVSPSFGLVYGFLSGGKDLPQKISESFSVENLPASLSSLASPNVQSVTFELCGTKVPELVKYEFPSEFKPLFVTDVNGQITPFGLFGVQAKGIQIFWSKYFSDLFSPILTVKNRCSYKVCCIFCECSGRFGPICRSPCFLVY